MKKQAKKLVLAKETVALMVDRRLGSVAGGSVWGWNTYSCGGGRLCLDMQESQTC
jgi:hypothetical protein